MARRAGRSAGKLTAVGDRCAAALTARPGQIGERGRLIGGVIPLIEVEVSACCGLHDMIAGRRDDGAAVAFVRDGDLRYPLDASEQ